VFLSFSIPEYCSALDTSRCRRCVSRHRFPGIRHKVPTVVPGSSTIVNIDNETVLNKPDIVTVSCNVLRRQT